MLTKEAKRERIKSPCDAICRLAGAIVEQAIEDYVSPDRKTLVFQKSNFRVPYTFSRRINYIQAEAANSLFKKNRLELLLISTGMATPETMRQIRIRAMQKQVLYNATHGGG